MSVMYWSVVVMGMNIIMIFSFESATFFLVYLFSNYGSEPFSFSTACSCGSCNKCSIGICFKCSACLLVVSFNLKLHREYDKRVALYNESVWTCQCTGATKLTHREALESEQKALKQLSGSFPVIFEKPVLELVHLS